MFDVIVVGGGPAGLMAAAAAAGRGTRVLLLEKGEKLGRKLIISGGGRCNVTNRKTIDDLMPNIPGNGRFLYSALSTFGPEQIIEFFEGLGIRLKEEDHGRMFPATDKAVTVARALIDHLQAVGVAIRLHSPVEALTFQADGCSGVRLRDGVTIGAGAVVVAVGGCSVPETGSTGDGYAWARAAGHTITPLYPAEVPLRSREPWIVDRRLQGLSLRDSAQTLFDAHGERLCRQRGDMIFTHFGLSGPATLRTSHYVSVASLRERVRPGAAPLRLEIDIWPDRSAAEAEASLAAMMTVESRRAVKNALRALLSDRLAALLLELAGIDGETTCAQLRREAIARLARLVKALPVRIDGTLPLRDAFVTGGGVSVKEVDPRTMGSRLKAGLYFAGEVLDVHAHTGGYNITVAFTTGHAAGEAAANTSRPPSTPPPRSRRPPRAFSPARPGRA